MMHSVLLAWRFGSIWRRRTSFGVMAGEILSQRLIVDVPLQPRICCQRLFHYERDFCSGPVERAADGLVASQQYPASRR